MIGLIDRKSPEIRLFLYDCRCAPRPWDFPSFGSSFPVLQISFWERFQAPKSRKPQPLNRENLSKTVVHLQRSTRLGVGSFFPTARENGAPTAIDHRRCRNDIFMYPCTLDTDFKARRVHAGIE